MTGGSRHDAVSCNERYAAQCPVSHDAPYGHVAPIPNPILQDESTHVVDNIGHGGGGSLKHSLGEGVVVNLRHGS